MAYLWFFVALVSSLAAHQLISNLAKLIRNRAIARTFPASGAWNCFLLLLLIEVWVAAPVQQSGPVDTASFLVFLGIPLGVTLMAFLIKPEPDWDLAGHEAQEPPAHRSAVSGPGTLDLAGQFNADRYYFFGILLALPVLSLARELLVGQGVEFGADFIFRNLIGVGALIGLFIRGKRADTVLAIAMVALLLVYTVVVFPTISGAVPAKTG